MLQTRGQAMNDPKIMLNQPFDSSFTADFKVRTFQNSFLSAYFNLMWVQRSEGTKFYVRLAISKLTSEGQISAFLIDFVKLSLHYLSFARTNFFRNLQTILLTLNHQHLTQFEGFAHGENYVYSRITSAEVNCMPSKFKSIT